MADENHGLTVRGLVLGAGSRVLRPKREGDLPRKLASYSIFSKGLGRTGGRAVVCQVWDADHNPGLSMKEVVFGVEDVSIYEGEVQYSGRILDISK